MGWGTVLQASSSWKCRPWLFLPYPSILQAPLFQARSKCQLWGAPHPITKSISQERATGPAPGPRMGSRTRHHLQMGPCWAPTLELTH